jgi:hypothetical protein
MDDDDLYEPTYISHSHHILKTKKVGCVGCDKMIFIYPPYTKDDFYALNACDKYLIHEATMMFYKSWYNKTEGFINCSRAEGLGITRSSKRKTIELTNPFKTMTAVVHGKNTIVKDKFKTDENNLADMSIDEKIRKSRKEEKRIKQEKEKEQEAIKAQLRRAVAPPQQEYNPFSGCY